MFSSKISYSTVKNILSHGSFYKDVVRLFSGREEGHMGKWQYFMPKYDADPARGALLWEEWTRNEKFYMLRNQEKLVARYAPDIARFLPGIEKIIDLGPGEQNAARTNTLPFCWQFHSSLEEYVAIDLCKPFADGAASLVKQTLPGVNTQSYNKNFLKEVIATGHDYKTLGLCFGGIIGNYASGQNTRHSVPLLARELANIKKNFPVGAAIVFGLDANQDVKSLYHSYDDEIHAAYEINVLFKIKRDLLSDQPGFRPEAWRYRMKWYPKSYQFCHIAECSENQSFWLDGNLIDIKKGQQFVIDNSFKFPVGIFQQAAIHAGFEPLASYLDDDKRMALHVLRVIG